MPKIIHLMFLLTLVLTACSKPTGEKVAEFKNNQYKVDVGSREFHESGIRNIDICVAEVGSRAFSEDKGQCFLRGFDFSNLSVKWALHVVERYFGTKVAEDTAYNLEYQGQGWKNPTSNAVYDQVPKS